MSGPNYDGRFGETNGTKEEPRKCEACGSPACYGMSNGQVKVFKWYCTDCVAAVRADAVLGR